jgi:hypothetical protein
MSEEGHGWSLGWGGGSLNCPLARVWMTYTHLQLKSRLREREECLTWNATLSHICSKNPKLFQSWPASRGPAQNQLTSSQGHHLYSDSWAPSHSLAFNPPWQPSTQTSSFVQGNRYPSSSLILSTARCAVKAHTDNRTRWAPRLWICERITAQLSVVALATSQIPKLVSMKLSCKLCVCVQEQHTYML